MRLAYLVALTALVACQAKPTDAPLPEPAATAPLPRSVPKEVPRTQLPAPAPAPKLETAPSTPETIQQLDDTLHELHDRLSR